MTQSATHATQKRLECISWKSMQTSIQVSLFEILFNKYFLCSDFPVDVVTVKQEILKQTGTQLYDLYNVLKFARNEIDLDALQINRKNVVETIKQLREVHQTL
jgi:hypothetical protein